MDTLGLNDISGKNPGFDIEKNKRFSEDFQHGLIQALVERGYEAKMLYATMGAHAHEKIEELTIYYADGSERSEQVWNGPTLPEEEKGWVDDSVVNYFETAFIESEYVNYKTGSGKLGKFNEIMNRPMNDAAAAKHRHAISPEGYSERKAILQKMPDVLSDSTADTILFVKVVGYELHRGKAALAAVISASASYNASGGTSTSITSYHSTSPMDAVAIDKSTGQVVWVAHAQGTRYSESAIAIPNLMARYPDAGGQ